MLILHQMPRLFGIPNISPPCMKLETWLRIAGIPYALGEQDHARAPKGKVPYIEEDGVLMGDSTLIVEHLSARYGVDPDAHLTPAQRAIGVAFRRLLKENFYWVIIDARWRTPANWAPFRDTLATSFAVPLEEGRRIVEDFKPVILDQLYKQGMGRHTSEEVHRLGIADMRAVSDFLGDNPYFLGDRPSTADATVYAGVSNILEVPIASPVKDWALGRPNLLAYCRRMRARFFPELSSPAV